MADNINEDSSDNKTIEKSSLSCHTPKVIFVEQVTNDDSSDNESIETSGPLNLYNLPVLVLDKVTKKLSLADCLSLRKVSQGLRKLVDFTEAHCKTLKFRFEAHLAEMTMDDLMLVYEGTKDDGCRVTAIREDTDKTKTYQDERHFWRAFLGDASTFLNNPKLQIDRNDIRDYGGEKLEFVNFLESLNSPLNVKSVRCNDSRLIQSIQKFLNPEKLEEIVYWIRGGLTRFIRLAETNLEFLKTPKLKIENLFFHHHTNESVAKFFKIMKSLNSELHVKKITIADGRIMHSILQSMNPEKVDDVHIQSSLSVEQFKAIARSPLWKTKMRLEGERLLEEIELDQYVDFKALESLDFKLTEENVIIIRDILIKSPYLKFLKLDSEEWNFPDELNAAIDRIMGEDPSYDASNRRFSIPKSRNYMQLDVVSCRKYACLTINRVESE